MGKYESDVKALLRYVGGKENIQAVSHCVTRMRFVLLDEGKADTKAIEELPSVKGTFTQAGQYQVIIGNDVSVFYNEFTAYAGIEGVSKDAVKAAAKTNQNPVQKAMGALGEIFAPLIPALICGGLILGFRNVIGEIQFFNNGTQSLADISQFWAVADRRGGISFTAGRNRMVDHKENGHDTDPGNYPWTDTGIAAAFEWIQCGIHTSSRDSGMGFWICPGADDWISGTGDRCDHGWICSGLSGEIL